MTWTRPNGSELPEWWEIEAEEKARAGMLGDVEKRLGWGSGEGYGSDSHSDQLSDFVNPFLHWTEAPSLIRRLHSNP